MIKFLLPIIFPSWRFFSSIGASPRVEFGFIAEMDEQPAEWICFRPLPVRVGFWAGVVCLFHNPQWNERLFLNTCAEHLFDAPSAFHEQEIGRRLLAAVDAGEHRAPADARFLKYRIRAVVNAEEGSRVAVDDVVFVAQPLTLAARSDQ